MPQFMLAVHGSDEPREPMTPDEMQAGFALVEALEADMRADDALLFSARLLEPAGAKACDRGDAWAEPLTDRSPRRRSTWAASTSCGRPTSRTRSRGPKR